MNTFRNYTTKHRRNVFFFTQAVIKMMIFIIAGKRDDGEE